jgi:hypothetical protein
MHRISLFFLILTATSSNFIPCRAQEKPAGKVQVMGFVPALTSSSGPRAEFLEAVAYYKQRYACLAESVPARNVRLAAGSSLLAKSLPTSPSRIMESRTL